LNSILVAIISVGIIASLFVAVQLLFRVGSNRYAAMWLGFFMVTLAFLNGMFLLVETGRILDFLVSLQVSSTPQLYCPSYGALLPQSYYGE
jgi:hypothetical protein